MLPHSEPDCRIQTSAWTSLKPRQREGIAVHAVCPPVSAAIPQQQQMQRRPEWRRGDFETYLDLCSQPPQALKRQPQERPRRRRGLPCSVFGCSASLPAGVSSSSRPAAAPPSRKRSPRASLGARFFDEPPMLWPGFAKPSYPGLSPFVSIGGRQLPTSPTPPAPCRSAVTLGGIAT